jgi:transposase
LSPVYWKSHQCHGVIFGGKVTERLGVTSSSLYNWIKAYGPNSEEHKQSQEQSDRIKKLEKELKRVTMERDILKEATVFFAGESKKNTRS